ncbi:MAG: hypothetical protein ACWA5P_12870 [bacterium]
MDITTIISTLSNEEKQHFVSYLRQRNKRNDAKNIQLFKLYQKETSERKIVESLYEKDNYNAYYGLKKRFTDNLIDFLATKLLVDEKSKELQIIKLIVVAKSLLQQNNKTGFKILLKAEGIAKNQNHINLLSEIYQTQIDHIHIQSEHSLDHLHKKLNALYQLQKTETELSILTAKLRLTLKNLESNPHTRKNEKAINNLLREFDDYKELSFKGLHEILSILNISAFIKNDFLDIDSYALHLYEIVSQNNRSESDKVYYHIQVIYTIANFLFRNKKFQKSLQFLDLMKTEITKNTKRFKPLFTEKHCLLFALNTNFLGHTKDAINIISDQLTKKSNDIENELDLKLGLAMCFMINQQAPEASKIMARLNHSDSFYLKRTNMVWVIQKNLLDIILRIELAQEDLITSRIASFKRSFKSYLKRSKQDRVLIYLDLLSYYHRHPQEVTSSNFKSKVENSFEWIHARREDIFAISFYAYLKSKMERTPVSDALKKLIIRAKEKVN